MRNMLKTLLFTPALVLAIGCAHRNKVVDVSAAATLKLLCASHAADAPTIDGRLDDACWQATEGRSDFSAVADASKGLARKSVIRAVYKDDNVYLGIEFFWDDIESLKRGVQEILDKHGPPAEGSCDFSNYTNLYGAELFVDKGATGLNYEQILINAAGQYTGNYKAMRDQFKGNHTVRVAVLEDRWTAEIVCPAPGVKGADIWGLNVCRNDETYYGIWRHINGAYAQPKLFGRLLMGSYEAWWDAVFAEGTVQRLDKIEGNVSDRPRLLALHAVVKSEAGRVARTAKKYPATSRENFEVLYHSYHAFKKNMDRLEIAYETYLAMQ